MGEEIHRPAGAGAEENHLAVVEEERIRLVVVGEVVDSARR